MICELLGHLAGEKLSQAPYLLELCSSRASWTVIPENVEEINLDEVGPRIVECGWELKIQTRFCWIFEGDTKLTLYPSGKLLIKTENDADAHVIAKRYVSEWM